MARSRGAIAGRAASARPGCGLAAVLLAWLIAVAAASADQRLDDNAAYWHGWEKRFDYVYVLFTDDDDPNPAPDRLRLLHDGGRFRLYRVIKPS